MNEISKRILEYIDYKNIKPLEFFMSIGYKSHGNYSRIRNGEAPSKDTIRAILRNYLLV